MIIEIDRIRKSKVGIQNTHFNHVVNFFRINIELLRTIKEIEKLN